MFKRLFWAALGAGAGLYAARRLKRTARRFTPAGLSERLSASGEAGRDFLEDFFHDVREAMTQRERQLHAALGLDGSAGQPFPGADEERESAQQEHGQAWLPRTRRGPDGAEAPGRVRRSGRGAR